MFTFERGIGRHFYRKKLSLRCYKIVMTEVIGIAGADSLLLFKAWLLKTHTWWIGEALDSGMASDGVLRGVLFWYA